ncbi:MAG: hypothetical protein LBN36_03075, partial [Clostridiales Family XIII bacterium]|nr:hypothetical protein [Clostridiales Family XIII bacterium]
MGGQNQYTKQHTEAPRVAFYTLGCKVNQYETQLLSERFQRLGFEVVDETDFADVYIVNSCTVTAAADKKSRNFARRTKRINPDAITALIGCYAEVSGESLAKISEIDLLIGSADKDSVVSEIVRLLDRKRQAVGQKQVKSVDDPVGNNDVSAISPIIPPHDQITEMDARTRAY